MKSILALAILVAATTTAAAQQRQANPPRDLWCMDTRLAEGSTYQSCMAYTLEQCLASRNSPSDRCYLNPIYDPRFRR
jgi:hypothetical protein